MNNSKTGGRLCQKPWRFTVRPYDIEPVLMKGRGGTPVRLVPAVFKFQNGGDGVTRATKRPTICDFP
jgi:hypothetical protein